MNARSGFSAPSQVDSASEVPAHDEVLAKIDSMSPAERARKCALAVFASEALLTEHQNGADRVALDRAAIHRILELGDLLLIPSYPNATIFALDLSSLQRDERFFSEETRNRFLAAVLLLKSSLECSDIGGK